MLIKNPEKSDFEGLEKTQYIEYVKGKTEGLVIEQWWVDIEKKQCN